MCSVCHKKLFITSVSLVASLRSTMTAGGSQGIIIPPKKSSCSYLGLTHHKKQEYPRWYHKKDLRIRFSHLEHSLVNSPPTEHIFFFGKLASLLIITLSSKCCNDMQQYTPWLITTKPGTLYSRNYYSLGNTKAVQQWVTRYPAWGQ